MQPVEGLLLSEMAHQVLVGEEVAGVPADAVDRDAAAARLHRHDGLGVARDGGGVAQELEELGLACAQRFAQLRCERARGRAAAQPARLERQPDVPAAQLGEEIGEVHSSISSRLASASGFSMSARPWMQRASFSTVGASNSVLTRRSRRNALRSSTTMRIASSEWPPSSKKLSWIPISSSP